jgi:hypothetical protein
MAVLGQQLGFGEGPLPRTKASGVSHPVSITGGRGLVPLDKAWAEIPDPPPPSPPP